MKKKKSSYGLETKRIVKVGTNVGGFIAKLATKNLLGISNKDKNASKFLEAEFFK